MKKEPGVVKYLRGYDNPCPDLFRIIIQHFKCKPDQTGGSCVCHAEAAGNRAKTEIEDVPSDLKYPVVGEGAQAPEDAEAPLQQTQQQYQASAREMADMARDIQTYFDSENLTRLSATVRTRCTSVLRMIYCLRLTTQILTDAANPCWTRLESC